MRYEDKNVEMSNISYWGFRLTMLSSFIGIVVTVTQYVTAFFNNGSPDVFKSVFMVVLCIGIFVFIKTTYTTGIHNPNDIAFLFSVLPLALISLIYWFVPSEVPIIHLRIDLDISTKLLCSNITLILCGLFLASHFKREWKIEQKKISEEVVKSNLEFHKTSRFLEYENYFQNVDIASTRAPLFFTVGQLLLTIPFGKELELVQLLTTVSVYWVSLRFATSVLKENVTTAKWNGNNV